MNRSEFLKLAFGTSATLLAFRSFGSSSFAADGNFTLAPLPYAYDALEPSIDKMTMEIHHDKHHQGYVTNLNKALGMPENEKMAKMSIDEIVKSVDAKTSAAIRNNAGGHWNHTFFWNIMGPNAGGAPKGALADAINKKFGSFDAFKTEFSKAATGRFGSGWAWLIKNGNDLEIISTPNQDNPMMALAEKKGTPIMGIDVWEHAYYLKYQNKRADYINAFWNVVDWNKVGKNFS
ncbi:superoxide dismutase [Spirosoma spitsbergense]|uniref:superoxide dismutase n=1 Tax=Spirosoma spitsbergense TaxID=431554 RepID=UPI0003667C51|nr:superoxide dismutase [Spirosoma spitsbergense]